MFCSCVTMPFQAAFRQSYRDSVSVTTQRIETQLMSSESLGRDLETTVLAG